MWENFYKNMYRKADDTDKQRIRKKVQTGRGLYRRFKGSYLIPVNRKASESDEQNPIQTKQVASVEANANTAISEFKDDTGKPHVKLLKGIKRRKRIQKVRKKKKLSIRIHRRKRSG